MAPAEFSVFVTARFERDYHRLLKGHADLATHYAEAISALKIDPYNRSLRHAIKKLEGVPAGEGSIAFVAADSGHPGQGRLSQSMFSPAGR